MTFRLSILFDTILRTILVFILNYMWIYFYLRKTWISILLSIFITAIISLLLLKYLENKNKKILLLKNKDSKIIEQLKIDFILNSNKQNIDIFSKIVPNTTKKSYFLIKNDENLIIYPFFEFKKFDSTNLFEVLKKIPKCKKVIILTTNFDKKIEPLIDKSLKM
jgi:hypothetical protein